MGEQLLINPGMLQNWVAQVEVDEGHLPGVMSAEGRRVVELERELRKLRRASGIHQDRLSVFAAAELDEGWPPPTAVRDGRRNPGA